MTKINRPGGFEITEKAINFCMFPNNAKILDIGCGLGTTVDYLVQNHLFDAYGIDKNVEFSESKPNLISAFAHEIPFQDNFFDGIIMECSFSLMENQETVLNECKRILKTNGKFIISEIYARAEEADLKGYIGNIKTKQNLVSMLENCGFKIEFFEDFTHQLQTYWGQMIFEKGAKLFYEEIGVCAENFKKTKCGYCLLIAKKD